MKILVFGTGSFALLYIKKSKEFFRNIEILAFLDNDSKKCEGFDLWKRNNFTTTYF